MKKNDVIFTLICGLAIGFVAADFLKVLNFNLGFYQYLLLLIFFAVISLMCLWIAFLIGQKFLFFFQAAKHLLVGAFVTVVDLKIFEFLIWFLALLVSINPLVSKGVSFLASTILKYLGNKYWAFQKNHTDNWHKEISQFFLITLMGLIIDVGSFYYFTTVMGPQFALSAAVWVKFSVIFAAFIAALWNFLGYKFFVFKK